MASEQILATVKWFSDEEKCFSQKAIDWLKWIFWVFFDLTGLQDPCGASRRLWNKYASISIASFSISSSSRAKVTSVESHWVIHSSGALFTLIYDLMSDLKKKKVLTLRRFNFQFLVRWRWRQEGGERMVRWDANLQVLNQNLQITALRQYENELKNSSLQLIYLTNQLIFTTYN